jgi:hypothetical protein
VRGALGSFSFAIPGMHEHVSKAHALISAGQFINLRAC